VLVTNDKDFGELAFLQQRIAAGIVLLRMPTFDTRQKADRLVYAVALLGERLLGSMIVVGERTIRRRRLPGL
jgi:predicted nuclease of predicted toxin-antitoxin system